MIEKIPFEQKTADHVLKICDLFIELSKVTGSLNTDQLKFFRKKFYKMYYNDKVELLQVSE